MLEVIAVVRLTIRISEELHEKLRWLTYKERRSQQVLLEEIIEKALKKIEVPKTRGVMSMPGIGELRGVPKG